MSTYEKLEGMVSFQKWQILLKFTPPSIPKPEKWINSLLVTGASQLVPTCKTHTESVASNLLPEIKGPWHEPVTVTKK